MWKRVLSCILAFGLITGGIPAVSAAESEKVSDTGYVDSGLKAMYGTPTIDGEIDEEWEEAPHYTPAEKVVSSFWGGGDDGSPAESSYRFLWDENALYILAELPGDLDIESVSGDVFNLYLDEKNDALLNYDEDKDDSKYQEDDLHFGFMLNGFKDGTFFDNFGNIDRLYFETKKSDDKIYVEIHLAFDTLNPKNGTEVGFELSQQHSEGFFSTTTYAFFDATGAADSDPSAFGELTLEGKPDDAEDPADPYVLKNYYDEASEFNMDNYGSRGKDDFLDALDHAGDLIDDAMKDPYSVEQKEINKALEDLKDAIHDIDDKSGLTKIEDLESIPELPDPFEFLNGDIVHSDAEWEKRAEEIKHMYEYYMYGPLPDMSDEEVSYFLDGDELTVNISYDGNESSFTATFGAPTQKVHDKAPVIISIGPMSAEVNDYAHEHGYATIGFNCTEVAADNYSRTGAFYDLHPYGADWQDQTGVLAAWGWGASKVIDALENGLAEEFGLSAEDIILTGVSRYGKATAVGGMNDSRIKMVVPTCSGAGGMANFRITSTGKIYDYSSVVLKNGDILTNYEDNLFLNGQNEMIHHLQQRSEHHWFNDNFMQFKDRETGKLPFDQHFLIAACADPDRYYMVTASYDEQWNNTPGTYATYKAAEKVYKFLGIEDQIAVNLRSIEGTNEELINDRGNNHRVLMEDIIKMIDFYNYNRYGMKMENTTMEELHTTIYDTVPFDKVEGWDVFDIPSKSSSGGSSSSGSSSSGGGGGSSHPEGWVPGGIIILDGTQQIPGEPVPWDGVTVGETGGALVLDTKTYTMAPGGIYDILMTLVGADVSEMRIYSSRPEVAEVTSIGSGKYRVTALGEGETYIMFEVWRNGVMLNHASVKVTIADGAAASGEANRIASLF